MKKFFGCLLIVLVLLTANTALAVPPDMIHDYQVEITPQKDGTFLMKYSFDYEAVTDFPSGDAYLEIGVPNRDFDLVEFAPSNLISQGKALKQSSSRARLEFYKLPLKGDRFQFSFTIRQKSILYEAQEGYTFQFIPGWFDFAEIAELKVKINTQGINLVSVSPTPVESSDSQLTFITKNLRTNGKAEKITLVLGKDYFSEIVKSTTNEKTSATNSKSEDSSDLTILWVILSLFGLVVVIGIISYVISCRTSSNSYSSDSYLGGYRGTDDDENEEETQSSSTLGHYQGTTTSRSPTLGRSSSGESSSESVSSPRSAGGSGDFSGRGASCVRSSCVRSSCVKSSCVSSCVHSCVCACACAGGGRVGCSEKGQKILRWIVQKQMERDHT